MRTIDEWRIDNLINEFTTTQAPSWTKGGAVGLSPSEPGATTATGNPQEPTGKEPDIKRQLGVHLGNLYQLMAGKRTGKADPSLTNLLLDEMNKIKQKYGVDGGLKVAIASLLDAYFDISGSVLTQPGLQKAAQRGMEGEEADQDPQVQQIGVQLDKLHKLMAGKRSIRSDPTLSNMLTDEMLKFKKEYGFAEGLRVAIWSLFKSYFDISGTNVTQTGLQKAAQQTLQQPAAQQPMAQPQVPQSPV
jgi:hypothetical protein